MTQKLFDIGKGALLGGRVSILVGSGTPGLSDDTLNARPGSLYLDDLDGGSYRKVRTAAGTDKWELIGAGLSPKVVSGVQGFAVLDQSWTNESAVVKWLVDVTRTNNPASRYLTEITALHDGSANTDATRVDWNDYGVLHFGPAIDGLAIGVRLSGSGSAQVVELTVAAAVAVDVVVRRADLGLYLGAAEPLDISAAPHAATHAAGSTDPLAIDAAQVISGTFDIARVPVAGSVPWDGVTGTPTTLAGYGISDAQAARATLGLGDAAVRNVGTTAGSIAAGDHTHAGVYEPANANLQAHVGTTGNPHATTADQVGAAPASHVGADGSAHPAATTATAGFMSAADKAKLGTIAASANAYTHPNHSGEVTSSGDGATTIAPNAVTVAKMQQVGANTVLGRASTGSGNVEVLAPAAARGVLGLGDAAVRNVGTTAGTVAAGDHAHTLDAGQITSGVLDIARLPQAALERLVPVANQTARYALTTATVQLGDTVRQLDTDTMYVVVDAANLHNAAGYQEYTAGSAAAVPWSGVTGKPTTLGGYGITDAQPYNANIQAHIGTTGNPHGTTAEQVGAMATSHAANAITGFGSTPAALGSAAVGSATTVARSDHVHPLPSAAQVGAAAVSHSHPLPSAADVGAAPASHVGASGTAHATATTETAGFMSAADKAKLAGIAAGATAYTHPVGDGNLHVPATGTGSAGQVLKAGATAGSAAWGLLSAAEVGAAAVSHVHPEYLTAAPVTSVAGRTGSVVLEAADVAGLGGAALLDVGTAAGTVAAGDHMHAPVEGSWDPVLWPWGWPLIRIGRYVRVGNMVHAWFLVSANGVIYGNDRGQLSIALPFPSRDNGSLEIPAALSSMRNIKFPAGYTGLVARLPSGAGAMYLSCYASDANMTSLSTTAFGSMSEIAGYICYEAAV